MHLKNNFVFIGGPRGSGKTYLAAGFFGKEKRAICWNSAFDVEFTARSTFQAQGGTADATKLWEIVKRPDAEFRIDFRPRDFTYNQTRTRLQAPSLEEISAICMDARNVHFYFDEAHKLLGAGFAPPRFLNILQEGRHRQVSMTMISHRIARIPRDFTQDVDDYYLFPTVETVDLEDIEERCGEVAAKIVHGLRRMDLRGETPVPGQYFHLNTITLEWEVFDSKLKKIVTHGNLGDKARRLF